MKGIAITTGMQLMSAGATVMTFQQRSLRSQDEAAEPC